MDNFKYDSNYKPTYLICMQLEWTQFQLFYRRNINLFLFNSQQIVLAKEKLENILPDSE